MELLGKAFTILMKLLPAAVIFTLLFSLEGNLRWLGLLGFIPLALAFCKGCTSCMLGSDDCKQEGTEGWKPWAGH